MDIAKIQEIKGQKETHLSNYVYVFFVIKFIKQLLSDNVLKVWKEGRKPTASGTTLGILHPLSQLALQSPHKIHDHSPHSIGKEN